MVGNPAEIKEILQLCADELGGQKSLLALDIHYVVSEKAVTLPVFGNLGQSAVALHAVRADDLAIAIGWDRMKAIFRREGVAGSIKTILDRNFRLLVPS